MFVLSEISPRVVRLRERYRDTVPALDAERTKILTDYHKKSANIPPIIRRAEALSEILANMTVRVEDDELIVGNAGKHPRSCCIWAEFTGLDWLVGELDSGEFDKRDASTALMTLEQEDRDYLRSVADYWRDNGVGAKLAAAVPEEVKTLATTGVLGYRPDYMFTMPHGHFNTNYRKAAEKGFGAVRREALEQLDKLRGRAIGTDAEKYFFYRAVVICCDAIIAFSKRYAAECRRIAPSASNERRAELLKMADSLDWIIENPARTFHDALQAIFLYHMVLNIDGNFLGLCLGRVDQHVGDYLDADIAAGRITESEAQELIDCFALKVGDMFFALSKGMTLAVGSYSNNMRLTIGGLKPDGSDATNRVTYMLLQSSARLHLHDPTLSLCIHGGTPDALWEAGTETAKLTGGIPTFDNCGRVIDVLMRRGLSLEDARNFCIVGCDEISGSGCDFSNVSAPFSKTFLSMPNALIQAINNGINPQNGKRGGLETGYLYEMETFDSVLDAFRRQIEYFLDWKATIGSICELIGNPIVQAPIASAMMDGCMESGRDMMLGGSKYGGTGGACLGMGTVIDSLLAIKHLVFDKKICTARELYDAVLADWEGYEPLRMSAKNEAPRYGNGDPEADKLAGWVSDLYANRYNSYVGPRGRYNAGIYSAGIHVAQGLSTWATPNGRLNTEPISDGISPSQGADRNGPVGIAQSVLACHPENYANGMQFCIKFHPTSVRGESGNEKLRRFIEAFFEQGGTQIQYNVISSEILREAKDKPDEYKNLVVRVAGFSAYFVELHERLQDDLIARTDNAV